MKRPEADDWALINRVRKDPEALGELFRRHKDFVYRVCWSTLRDESAAQDAAQDVFLRLAKQRRKLSANAQFRTWLYRVAANVVRDCLRREQIRAVATERDSEDHRASAETDTRLGELSRALEELSERQCDVVVLRIFEGFDTRETAEALDISEGSVKTHLHRALAALRTQLT